MGPLSLSPVSEDRLQISNVLSRLANTHTYTQTKITVLHINTHTISAVSLRCPLPVLRCCFVTNFRCKAALNLLVQKKRKYQQKSQVFTLTIAIVRLLWRVWECGWEIEDFSFPFFVLFCVECVCVYLGERLSECLRCLNSLMLLHWGACLCDCVFSSLCVCVCARMCVSVPAGPCSKH